MCHSIHEAKEIGLFVQPIKQGLKNPHTGKELDKIDALCMTCHAAPPYGRGIRSLDLAKKHPFGIEPILVKLPPEATGFGGLTGHLSCMGCHDPHPSNQNWAYLRAHGDTGVRTQKEIFLSCLWCHPYTEEWLGGAPSLPERPAPKKDKKQPAPGVILPSVGGIDLWP